MLGIEECSEKLNFLEKTLAIEERQNKRRLELSQEKEKEQDESSSQQLCGIHPSTQTVLDQEEALRKKLVDSMVQNTSSSNTPVVKVLTNLQGKKYTISAKISFYKSFIWPS